MKTFADKMLTVDELYSRVFQLEQSLAEMVGVYWGDGDGHEPPPACIQRAMAALASIKEAE